MAALETLPYQTHQDDQERPVVAYLGELPIHIPTGLVRAFLAAQVPYITRVANDPKAKTIRLAFKAAAKVAMDFIVMPKARRGEMPWPDEQAMRADILGYSVLYWSDLVLHGMQSVAWDLTYVEEPDGAIQITRMAATAFRSVVCAEPPAEDSAPDAQDPSGQAIGRSLEPSLVPGGNDGERQNDVCETTRGGIAEIVA